MASATDETFRLVRPPVRSVELTLYFKPLAQLKVTAITPLLAKLTESYQVVEERFAQGPWDSDIRQADYYPENGEFPFPWLTFADNDGHTIGFQSDRFRIAWAFDEGRAYEGFEVLRKELVVRFNEFSAIAEKVAGERPMPLQAECEYVNDIGDVGPLQVGLSAMFDREVPISDAPLVNSIRHSFHAELPVAETSALTFQAAIHVLGDDGNNTFVLVSQARPKTSANVPFSDLLDEAHRVVLSTFRATVTPSQIASWGTAD